MAISRPMPSRRPTPLQLLHQAVCPNLLVVLTAEDGMRLCQPSADVTKAIKDSATMRPEGDKELPTEKKVMVQGICRGLSSNWITRITQNKIVVDYNPLHPRVSLKVHSLFIHDMGAIIYTKCPMLAPSLRKLSLNVQDEITTYLGKYDFFFNLLFY